MKSFLRLMEFVWPHRRRLILSVVFAFGVAALWSFAILLTFPVMQVLLNDQSIAEYVQEEIDVVEHELQEKLQTLNKLSDQNATSDTDDSNLRKTGRAANLIGSQNFKLVALRAVQSHLVPYLPKDRFDTLAIVLGILLVCTALRGISRFIQEVLVGSVVQLVIIDMRKKCFRRMLALDYQSVAMHGTADLMSRFTHDTKVIAAGLKALGIKVIREPLKAFGCVVCAFIVNWQLTLISLILVPPAAILLNRIGRRLKKASRRMMESMSRIYKVLEETIDGLKIVIAYDGARKHRQQFHRQNKSYYQKVMKIVRLDAMTSPMVEMLGMIAVLMVVLPGAYLVCRQQRTIAGITLSPRVMDFSELATLYALLISTIDPLRKLSSVYSVLRQSSAASERIFTLIDREPQVVQKANGMQLPRLSSSLEFKDVTFQYKMLTQSEIERPPALDHVSLKINAGECVAIVGENGSGKSTLVNLLPRFFDADRGTVMIDGVDIVDASIRDLRSQMSIVTQETLLFDDTIEGNIRYGRQSASEEEIRAAADKADILDFIEGLPEQFNTQVGIQGRKLSGGQRQRLALARALIRDPSILILDEATSAVDAQSEVQLYHALRKSAEGRTTLIVTHFVGPQLLQMLSRIAVMDRGRLVAFGTHEEVMASCPIYQRLFHARMENNAA